MPGRLRQKNSLGECQSCGDWPNNPQQYTANCPTGATGDPVTVTIPAGTYYADTIENADELALEEAQEQAEAALECVFPACTYSAIPSYASAGETAWRQYLFQLTTNGDPGAGVSEYGFMSEDGKRVVFTRFGFGPLPEYIGSWVVDTSEKPNDGSGSYRDFWASGMTPFAFSEASDALQFGTNPLARAYDFVAGSSGGGEWQYATWRATDYSNPEFASGVSQWLSISGNGATRIGILPSGQYLIRCDDEPDFLIPEDEFTGTAGSINYCGTRAIGTNAASVNGFWDKTGAGIWEFTERPIQAGWEADSVTMELINGEGNIIFGSRIQDGTGDAFLVRWVDGVPTAYANDDGFVLNLISEDGSTAVMRDILENVTEDAPASIWDPVNGFRNLYDLVQAVNFLFSVVGPAWEVNSMHVQSVSGNGKHLLIAVAGPSFDQIRALQYVYLG